MEKLEDSIKTLKPKEEFSLTNDAGAKGVKCCIIGSDVDNGVDITGTVEIIPSAISIKQREGRKNMKRTVIKTTGNMGIIINDNDPNFTFGKEYQEILVWNRDEDSYTLFHNARVVCASGKSTPETRMHSEGIILTEILVIESD